MNNYKITKYPDGTSYVTVPKEWEETTQELVFRINSYEDVIHLAQLCDILIYNRVDAHIVIPCLLDAQADKRFDEFQSSGLKVLARVLDEYLGDSISFGIFHPHNPEVVEALFSSVGIIDNSKFIYKVLDNLNNGDLGFHFLGDEGTLEEDLILMSSDAGGFKPLMKLCDKIDWKGETYSAAKARLTDGTIIQNIGRNDFKGKDILIVDDICVYGGTFKGLSKLLRERNCGKLYLAVSHMTIQNLGEDPVTNYFDKVFTTNSKFDNYVSNYTEYVGDKIDPLIYEKIEHNNLPKNLEIIKLFKT